MFSSCRSYNYVIRNEQICMPKTSNHIRSMFIEPGNLSVQPNLLLATLMLSRLTAVSSHRSKLWTFKSRFSAESQLRGRGLRQSAGSSIGVLSGIGSTMTSSKVLATGNTCYIAYSPTTTLDCRKEGVGTYYQQIPACCSSSSNTANNTCSTFDNGGSILCTSTRKYPACCELR